MRDVDRGHRLSLAPAELALRGDLRGHEVGQGLEEVASFREIGDQVRPGDPLFEILPDPTPMELTEARRVVMITHDMALARIASRVVQIRDRESFERQMSNGEDA